MIVGHLAVAFAAKRVEPRVPLGAGVAAAYGLDLLWPLLLVLGVESVRIEPDATAFNDLDFQSYPWSHSLLMTLVWSGAAAVLARAVYGSWRIAGVIAALVTSHWVLDWVTHRPDLPLWPGGPELGLGLWYSLAGTYLAEGLLLLWGLRLYHSVSSSADQTGRWALYALVALTTLIWITQPLAPPPPSPTAIAVVGFALWLLPPWAHWIEKHRIVYTGP